MITGIIMASGFSKRMDKNKLLLCLDGVPIIEKVIKAVKSSNVEDIILVYRDEEIEKIGKKYKLTTIFNSKAQYGQSESMKLGIINSSSNTSGYMFFVGDQPFLDSNSINVLKNAFNKNNHSIIVPRYNGKKGNPVIFPKVFKDKLLRINGDEGGRKIIKDYNNSVIFIDFVNTDAGLDIDTWDEYIFLNSFNNEINTFHC